MASSGLYNFGLSNAGILIEAFDRIGIEPQAITRHRMNSARTSLNLELSTWSNKGFNFWELASGTINLVADTATYTLPPQLAMLTDLWYSNVNGGGAGVNQDRIMVPITRDVYAMLTNKLQQGIPTQYWFQMLLTPQITIWQVPNIGAPNYVLGWYGLSQIQDANLGSGETPNIHYRAQEALVAGCTVRLAEKFMPARLAEKKQLFTEAWDDMARRDQEPGAITYRPDFSAWSRLR
jgi:hypothetical protein